MGPLARIRAFAARIRWGVSHSFILSVPAGEKITLDGSLKIRDVLKFGTVYDSTTIPNASAVEDQTLILYDDGTNWKILISRADQWKIFATEGAVQS